MKFALYSLLSLSLLTAAGLPCYAQEPASSAAAPITAPVSSQTANRLAQLEREVATLRTKIEDGASTNPADQLGFQLQLRLNYFVNDKMRRSDAFAATSNETEGWGIAVGLRLPLWQEIIDSVDLVGALDIGFRQLDDGPHARAPITNEETTVSYINIVAAPMLQFKVSDFIRPFVFVGVNVQVESPPTDGISYVDLGLAFGGGVDFRVIDKISVGIDMKYSIFGVGDQEDTDYLDFGLYLGFNF